MQFLLYERVKRWRRMREANTRTSEMKSTGFNIQDKYCYITLIQSNELYIFLGIFHFISIAFHLSLGSKLKFYDFLLWHHSMTPNKHTEWERERLRQTDRHIDVRRNTHISPPNFLIGLLSVERARGRVVAYMMQKRT